MKIGIRVPQVVSIFKELQQNPEQIFRMARLDVREMVGRYLSKMIGAGLTHFLGRGPYERKDAGEAEPGAGNHRNGPYHRSFTLKGIGELSTMVPRDGNGQYHTQILPRSRQDEGAIAHDLCLLFPEGVSTRAPALMTERLVGRKISHTELNRTNGELKEAVEKWRNREMSQERVKDLFVDEANFRMRIGDSIEWGNKEFRRRTKPMGARPGGAVLLRIPCILCIEDRAAPEVEASRKSR